MDFSNLIRNPRSSRSREALAGYLFAAPWLIGLAVFQIGPLLASFAYSFTDYPIIAKPKFIGMDNYSRMLGDKLFLTSIRVTLTYTVFSVLIYVVASLFLAMLCNRSGQGVGLVRLLVFLPSLIPPFAAAVLWGWMFNTDFGIVNYVLTSIGLPQQGFFQSPSQALPLTIILGFWGMGSAFLIYLSGLQSVPTDLYDAIVIDGAGLLRKFWHITLPMLSPVILFNTIIGIVISFQVFDLAWLLTRGGPANSTLVWVLYIYRTAFEQFEMGYSSALAVVLFMTVALTAGVIFRTSRWWVYYEAKID